MAVLIVVVGLNTEASVVKADGVFTNLSQPQIVAEMGDCPNSCVLLDYIGSAPYYSIDHSLITRVKEVVDYVVDNDMYAIIDLHNDGVFLSP